MNLESRILLIYNRTDDYYASEKGEDSRDS